MLIGCSVLAYILLNDMIFKGSFFGNISFWGGGFNPPETRQMAYSFAVFGILLSANLLVERIGLKPLICLRNAISWIGRYSLYIFLFHIAILTKLNQSSIPIWCEGHIWVKRFVYMGLMIGVSIAAGMLIDHLIKHGKDDFEKILLWIKK